MKTSGTLAAVLAAMLVPVATVVATPAHDALLARYAEQARTADPGFAGFDAARGRALYMGPHVGGKPKLEACAVCHTRDPTATGRHVGTGRDIAPMAVSANAERFTDRDKVEKRFSRDCPNVLGRDCSAQERGDFITWLLSR